MEIDEVLFTRLRDKFTIEWKKVENYKRRPLTKNLNKRREYRENIVLRFNNICSYLGEIYQQGDLETKLGCIARVNPYIERCKTVFELLHLRYEWPKEELSLINIISISSLDDEELLTGEDSEPEEENLESNLGENSETQTSATSTNIVDTESGVTPSTSATSDSQRFFETNNADDSQIDELIHNLSSVEENDDTNRNTPQSSRRNSNRNSPQNSQVNTPQHSGEIHRKILYIQAEIIQSRIFQSWFKQSKNFCESLRRS